MKKTFHTRRGVHIILLTLAIGFLIGLFYLLARTGISIPCLFHKFTGLQCPGCGNSRAAIALLQLDIKAALQYNLLFPLEFGYLVWVYGFCCVKYLRGERFAYRPPVPAVDIMILITVIVWGVVRNMI